MVYVYPYILSWLSRSPHISRRKVLQAKSGHTRKRKKQEEKKKKKKKKHCCCSGGNRRQQHKRYLAADNKNYEEE